MRRALALLVILLCMASVCAVPASARTSACRVPQLRGLTLSAARARVRHARCALEVRGAAPNGAKLQMVERQRPAPRGRSAKVTVWLGSVPASRDDAGQTPVSAGQSPEASSSPPKALACYVEERFGPGAEGPFPAPRLTPGSTALVSGLYFEGGPPRPPGCPPRAPWPSAETVEVMNAASEVVATQTSATGGLIEIPLPAGSYTIASTFVSATICNGPVGAENCGHPSESYALTIPPGYTVRKDFVLNIP